MNILIINFHSSHNSGDNVLVSVTLDMLYRHFPDAKITLAMNDPASYSGMEQAIGSFTTWFKHTDMGHAKWKMAAIPLLPLMLLEVIINAVLHGILPNVPSFNTERRRLFQAYRDADFVVSCPGNFLYSSGRFGITFVLSIFTIWYALCLGKPLYAMPQTIGPVLWWSEAWLLGRLLPRYRLLYVRDHISLERLAGLGVKLHNATVIPDIAFDFSSRGAESGRRFLTAQGVDLDRDRPLLGVTVIDWGAQNHAFADQKMYEEAVACTVRNFLQDQQGQAIFFAQVHGPTDAEDDRIPAKRVAARLAEWGERVVVASLAEPTVLKAAYGQMDIFLGTRLHSCIFALSEYVPVVSIGYQYKSRGLFRLLGMEGQVVDIEDATETNLSALLVATWKERAQFRQRLSEQIPLIRKQVRTVGERIYDDQIKRQRSNEF